MTTGDDVEVLKPADITALLDLIAEFVKERGYMPATLMDGLYGAQAGIAIGNGTTRAQFVDRAGRLFDLAAHAINTQTGVA